MLQLELAVNGKVRIFIAAVSCNNIYYNLRQSMSGSATLRLLEELAGMTEIPEVTTGLLIFHSKYLKALKIITVFRAFLFVLPARYKSNLQERSLVALAVT
ncbi:hypothetical protein C7T94_06095 [Pedobacter yulinensis]|uniref:Uncharacterized protein n=1 Tax=Pedobacter yulinensis TaxID=2126353 RepID=A0A2T3HPB0_9SPHI|nr:hypothetical protein C7T94_06095 [Pedobacter yulinensis]